MKDSIYVVYNRLSNRYISVFSSPTNATAIRAFQNAYKDILDDFELCNVGEIDLMTGVVTSLNVVRVEVPKVVSPVPINDIENNM